MKTLFLGAALVLGTYQAQAQLAAARDSSQLAGAVHAARQHYLAAPPESRLVNGVAYANAAPSYVAGRPYFQTSDPRPGTLDFDGQHFEGVYLLYEQVQDQVLLYGPAQAGPLQLVRQQVQAFELAGHQFVRLPASPAGGLAEGFYDQVVAGPARLLVKRAKKLAAAAGGYSLKGEYEDKTQFFVQRGPLFYEVATLRQALAALADQRAEMQAYARGNRLRFATDSREASLVALLKHYNSLAKP